MTTIQIIDRNEAGFNMRYEVQTQAPAGNWVQCLGTNDRDGAIRQATFYQDKLGKTVRIVDNTPDASEHPETLRMARPDWAFFFTTKRLEVVYDLETSSAVGEDCLKVIDACEALLAICRDIGETKRATIMKAVAHQCEVYYYG